MTQDAADWPARADTAQRALSDDFGTRFARLRYRNGSRPLSVRPFAFNYWWFAHLIEARVDAFERSGDEYWLADAERVLARLRRRNGGRLENDYFDDMGWLTIALLRLHEASGRGPRLDDAIELWGDIRRSGWNDLEGPSMAWRRSQLDYKNAPSTGAFAIASALLARLTDSAEYDEAARESLAWLEARLVRPDGLVADGVNRLGDGRVDDEWLFSYNQGLYIGALVASHARSGETAPLSRALRTASATLARLAPDGVIAGENADLHARGGGDIGLFKGVFVRYLGQLIERSDAAGITSGGDAAAPVEAARRFIRRGADLVWAERARTGSLRVGDDWSRPAPPVTALSTQLSAVILLETRARLT
ncbi:MAG: glycosyl hydrolase [Herbiconiux sp.]|uniref:glycoside hydrolase family 76 protein n=1 Tax=Herbiconiux sp. TaxID=1871186 RepID=UPI0011F4AFC5|nr:glycoside hydrolase family 76 protein [Herbiconiux sp.]TAJ46741.1 MAG: glycosyl hydrolase [Herbiconiux sp.]